MLTLEQKKEKEKEKSNKLHLSFPFLALPAWLRATLLFTSGKLEETILSTLPFFSPLHELL